MMRDPVCDMEVDANLAARRGLLSEYEAVTYHFCGQRCKQEFDRYPAIYIGRAHERDHPDADGLGQGDNTGQS